MNRENFAHEPLEYSNVYSFANRTDCLHDTYHSLF